MTFIEKFEQIKKEIGKPDASKLNGNIAVQINLTDDDCGGAFYVSHIDGVTAIEPYDYRDNTASVNIVSADFINALNGKLDIAAALSGNRIAIFGNADHFYALLSLKKAPVKRATAGRKANAEKKATATKKTAPVKKAPAEKKSAAKKAPIEKKSADVSDKSK